MYFQFDDTMTAITQEELTEKTLCVGLIPRADLRELQERFHFSQRTLQDLDVQHQHTVNKLDSYFGYCFGIVNQVRWKDKELQFSPLGIYFKKNFILLVIDDEEIQTHIVSTLRHIPNTSYCLAHVLTAILECLLAGLHPILEDMETAIEQLEEEVSDNRMTHTTTQISELRRIIMLLAHYVAQMMDIAEELQQDENTLFSAESVHFIRIFADRVQRYEQNIQMLKDYVVQVRELQQAQSDLNLNRMMYVFTIVTIIFLPLTLIVGWYGMNFTNMPELRWRYGYLFVILLSIATIVGCFLYFKRKNILKK